MMRYFLILVLLLPRIGLSQDFVAEAYLGKPEETGFYKFEIFPSNSSWLTQEFANLRILDPSGQHVPYIIEEDSEYITQEFVEYKTSRTVYPGRSTNLIIENPDDKPIQNVHIRIRNADTYKTAVLSGSDNNQDWYALKDRFYLDPVRNPQNVSELRVLDFPLSNYRYYRLVVNDSASAPLHIVSVGFYKTVQKRRAYWPLPPASIARKDSTRLKQTFIWVELDTSHWVDRIKIGAKGSPFFLRLARLYEIHHMKDKRGTSKKMLNLLDQFELSNERGTAIDIKGTKGSRFLLVVDNLDNPVLPEIHIELLQLRRIGIAWLEKDKEYRLAAGNLKIDAPSYDLPKFKSKLPVNMLSLTPLPLHATPAKSTGEPGDNLWNRKSLVWIAIVGVILLLGILSARMIREAKASGKA
jgi:hypothetical protein